MIAKDVAKQTKRPAEAKKPKIAAKKPKVEIVHDENKANVAIVFLGDLDQAFQLNDANNKKTLRDSIKKSCPTWNVHVCITHLHMTVGGMDLETAKNTIPKIADIQKTMPIVALVLLPGVATNPAAYNPFLIELLNQTNPMVTIGVMTSMVDDLWQKTDAEVTAYHTYMTNLYTIFMQSCPRISVINLTQPAEFRPKATVQSFIDRLSGRIRPLIPSSKDIKTAMNQATTAAATGHLDFGSAEDVQTFLNVKKLVSKEKKNNKNATTTQQVQLRSQNSQQ